jgi:Holliday junction resolvasome RuvABC ATP-dependent DNA helicase subunit
MSANFKSTNGSTFEKSGDFAGLLATLEDGDVLFIDEINRLRRVIEETIYSVMIDFKIDVTIDQGPNARNVRLNLPRFTIIGTSTSKDELSRNLLSCFQIVESMGDYSIDELIAITHRFAKSHFIELGEGAAGAIARYADGTPLDVLNLLRHVRDYAIVRGDGKINLTIAETALKMLVSSGEKKHTRESREAIPSEVRHEVWRRDEGKCVKCGSRANLEYDHIIPVSKGGSNTARNIELLCESCNRAKSDLIQ